MILWIIYLSVMAFILSGLKGVFAENGPAFCLGITFGVILMAIAGDVARADQKAQRLKDKDLRG